MYPQNYAKFLLASVRFFLHAQFKFSQKENLMEART